MDKLKNMWDQQEEFMRLLQKERKFPQFPVDIKSKTGQQQLKQIRNHLFEELFEAGQHLKNDKNHRITNIPNVNKQEYIEELVDAAHLYFELLIMSGISINEFYDAYMKKGDINVNRIKNGY
jgi:hypothetical protein